MIRISFKIKKNKWNRKHIFKILSNLIIVEDQFDQTFERHRDGTATFRKLLPNTINFGTKMVDLFREFRERSFNIARVIDFSINGLCTEKRLKSQLDQTKYKIIIKYCKLIDFVIRNELTRAI